MRPLDTLGTKTCSRVGIARSFDIASRSSSKISTNAIGLKPIPSQRSVGVVCADDQAHARRCARKIGQCDTGIRITLESGGQDSGDGLAGVQNVSLSGGCACTLSVELSFEPSSMPGGRNRRPQGVSCRMPALHTAAASFCRTAAAATCGNIACSTANSVLP